MVAAAGEPDQKQIVSPQQVMWHYSYLSEEHRTRPGWFGAVVEQTTGYKKVLDVLFENDVVINFTYVKVPILSKKGKSGSRFWDITKRDILARKAAFDPDAVNRPFHWPADVV